MGLFDYFSKEAGNRRKLERCHKRLTNMYYQSAERMGAAQEAAELVQAGELAGIGALLARFEHLNPSSTTDREEKEHVLQLLCGLGEKAVEPVVSYITSTTRAVYWPLRFLQAQWPKEQYQEFLAELIESFTTDYVRDPAKKIGVVQLAADQHTPRMEAAVRALIDDHNETVRVHVIEALVRFEHPELESLLRARYLDPEEDSGRILRQIATQFAERGWSVGADAEAFQAKLPGGFLLNRDGTLRAL